MKLRTIVFLTAIFSPVVLAMVFKSSSGQEQYETGTIIEPENNDELKEVLQKAYDAMIGGDRARFPLALGGGGYYLKDHWQGLSFGAHAFGQTGQPYLSTHRLQKTELTKEDFKLDFENRFALVRVKGGNTLGQVLDMANAALPEHLKTEYELSMTAPSSSRITVAGALAAHTHYRATYIFGGYFLDQVEDFILIVIQDGKAMEIFCSRKINADLFHSIPGSFGRGGVISDVTLKLQLMPKSYKPTTRMRKFEKVEDFNKAFAEEIVNLKKNPILNEYNKSILGVNGFMSDNYYYVFNFNFEPEETVKDAPNFDLFKAPNFLTFLGHFGSHSLHGLANLVTEHFVLRDDQMTFKNEELRPWLFFHDGYLEFWQQYDSLKELVEKPKSFISEKFGDSAGEAIFGRTMQTAHQAYVMKFADFERFLTAFNLLLEKPEFQTFTFKFRDFVPLPSTRTLMSPAYSEDENELFIAVTLSWPVNSEEEKSAIDAMKEEITAIPYVKVHPHKEFDTESDLLSKTYFKQAQIFESILKSHNIDDRMIWTKMHKALFQKQVP